MPRWERPATRARKRQFGNGPTAKNSGMSKASSFGNLVNFILALIRTLLDK